MHPRSRFTAILTGATAMLLALFVMSATASAASTTKVSEVPVSFTVSNVNQTLLLCATDGRTYTIRGHLIGTAAELKSSKVTLLLHGLGLGEYFWDFQGEPGYNFAANLAQLGHASVAIDRLGYGTSGKSAGTGSCIGGQADIAHQIIQQLKSGAYHGSRTPAFAKVGLIGHSAGGQITEVESYTYHDAQAIGILAYADQGLSAFQLSLGQTAAATCAAGGDLEDETTGPGGYVSLAGNLGNAFTAFLHSAPVTVESEVTTRFSLDPCGDVASYSTAPTTDMAHLSSITQPVLLVQGGKDTLFPPPSVADQAKLFTGSSSVTYADLPNAGHALTFEQGHVQLDVTVAHFLRAHGL